MELNNKDRSESKHGSRSRSHSKFTVMTWNILAQPYTHYNKEHHRNFQDVNGVETLAQTRLRYQLASECIIASSADVVSLQECEPKFFTDSINPLGSKLVQLFEIHGVYGNPQGPGAVTMVRRDRGLVVKSKSGVVGTRDTTGGSSKSAAAVLVQIGKKEIWVISAHFAWKEQPRAYLLQQIRHAVSIHTGQMVCLMGDFNTRPNNLLLLESKTWLRDMQRIELGNGVMTGLSADFKRTQCIDHVYVSPNLFVLTQTISTEKHPTSPYGILQKETKEYNHNSNDIGAVDGDNTVASIVGVSDHVWIQISFDVLSDVSSLSPSSSTSCSS